ncbi:small integral membrane protein 19 isoform X1 [Simochromis diagramma]|uniref:small integral membrane protein 19 isoform X1 n=1 Tax=Simochromis diagramma TaxID=43689 RepID=UPI001A7EC319|nr:small integral membrane protein 19 isoform X1 [Simochromis diagramma]
MGAHGVLGNEPDSIDYSVHEAWNEATNVYLLVILVSFGLLMYARKNKRKIMRIFTLPPTAGSSPEPNFYDSLQKVRLRQQLEMYSLGRWEIRVGSGFSPFLLHTVHTFLSLFYLSRFKDPLHTTPRYAMFSANLSVGIALLLQKYYFMPTTLLFVTFFLRFS